MTAVDTQCWGTDLQGGGAWEGLWCLLGSLSHSQGVLGGLVGECMFTREIRDSVSGASTADGTVSEMLLPCLVLDQLGRSAKKKKYGAFQCCHPWRTFPQIPASLVHILKLVSGPSSCIPLVLFKLLPLC